MVFQSNILGFYILVSHDDDIKLTRNKEDGSLDGRGECFYQGKPQGLHQEDIEDENGGDDVEGMADRGRETFTSKWRRREMI